MEYTNEQLKKMEKRLTDNDRFCDYLKQMGAESSIDVESGVVDEYNSDFLAFHKRGSSIGHCLDYWKWFRYDDVKVLDLVSVSRCKNTRFCPNCKKLEAAKYIHKIKPIYEELLSSGKYFYFLTLTIPSLKNCTPEELSEYVDYLYKRSSRLFKFYTFDIEDKKAFPLRSVDWSGGIRILEITYNIGFGYHPHLHCLIVTDEEIPAELLQPKHKAKYSRKRKSVDYKSDLECELAKLWTLLFYNKYRVSTYNNYDYNPARTHPVINGEVMTDMKNLEVNFREMDERGFQETFKYTVKTSEIKTYTVFKTLWYTLFRRRIRQGFGSLYRLEINDCIDEKGEEQELPPECEGLTPDLLITWELKDLYTKYREYKKVSRFTPDEERDILNDVCKIED